MLRNKQKEQCIEYTLTNYIYNIQHCWNYLAHYIQGCYKVNMYCPLKLAKHIKVWCTDSWTDRQIDGQWEEQIDDGEVTPICQPIYASGTKKNYYIGNKSSRFLWSQIPVVFLHCANKMKKKPPTFDNSEFLNKY